VNPSQQATVGFAEERLAEASLMPPEAAFSASGRRRSDEVSSIVAAD
jgi:hypothetical protein